MSFSVLMSVYKKERPEYLKMSLESVLQQRLSCDEIIIIEDGILTEALYKVIDDYKEKYSCIKTYRFEENVMLGRALSKGVELCKNDIIARMDTDDIALPDRFEKEYGFLMKHPEIAVVGGEIEEFNDEEEHVSIKKMPEHFEEIMRYGKYRNPLNHMTVMFRKKAVLEVGNYIHFPFLEDYYLWIRMMAAGYRFHNLQEVMVKARTSKDLYKRRGGFSYFKTYKKLRREQKRLTLLNNREYFYGILCSFFMTMQPGFLRKLVYVYILRRK